MVYADFDYYTSKYMGTAINTDDFPRLALRASVFLDYYTQGRVENNADLDAVKMACCALAEQYQIIEYVQKYTTKSLDMGMRADGAEVQSETVGSWSRTYRSGLENASSASASVANAKASLAPIVREYLCGTGLLYRGGRA